MTPHIRLARVAFALFLLPLLVVGCADRRTSPDEIVVAIQAEGSTLDPHQATDAGSFRLIENMYSTLLRYTPDFGEIEPDLLEAHEHNDDFTAFSLTIRPDARFHATGRNVTAEDVRYSLERIQEMGLRAEPLATLDAIEVTGTYTLELRFTEPMTPLLNYLAHPMYAIVDREVVEQHGNLDRADAGSGPYRLVEWRRDQRTVLEADPDYYVDGLPRTARLVYRPIPDETARSTALVNGEVDLVLDVPVQRIDSIAGEDHITIEAVPGTFWEYVGLNTDREPFDDVRVRQAISWAIDRDRLNRDVKYGRALPLTGGHIPPHHWAHADVEVYPEPDLNRARSLLAEAGYEDGFSSQIIVGSHSQPQVQAASQIRQMLAPLGIEVSVNTVESTAFFARLNNRDFDMTVVGWVGFFDPDEWLYPVFHSQGAYNQQNYGSDEVDGLLQRGRRTADRDERTAIYRDAQQLVAEEAPVVFLYLNEQVAGYANDLEGFVVHPTASTIFLRDAHKDRTAQ